MLESDLGLRHLEQRRRWSLIGTDVSGSVAIANNFGVEIDQGASSNVIGTSGQDGMAGDALERNVISANIYEGVLINGAGSDQNVVAGNYIGTTASGETELGNGSRDYIHDPLGAAILGGVAIVNGASDNLIGTSGQRADDAGERNIISGNLGDGVDLYGSGAGGNVIAGNSIGTDATGTDAIANGGDGVYIAEVNAANWVGVNSVQGPENADEGNVLSANRGDDGVEIFDSSGQVVAGNFIGTNAAGTAALPNDSAGVAMRIPPTSWWEPRDRMVPMTLSRRNVISGNTSYGVAIKTFVSGTLTSPVTTGNVVAGNWIGTNAAGTDALPNGADGVAIASGSYTNWIGVNSVYGPENAAQGNVISGNSGYGIEITGSGTNNNVVAGNLVGLNASGTTAIANANFGVFVTGGAANTQIGTNPINPNALERNVVSGNDNDGVHIQSTGPGTVVAGNYIGTNSAGTVGIGNGVNNGGDGVCIENTSTAGVTVGGTVSGDGNVISANYAGVLLTDGDTAGSSDVLIAGNLIGTNAAGTAGCPTRPTAS